MRDKSCAKFDTTAGVCPVGRSNPLLSSVLCSTQPKPWVHPDMAATNHRSLFLQGLLTQITNPKALLFVSALLPQFIDPHKAAPPQLGILVLTTNLVDTAVLSSYAFLASRGAQSFRDSRTAAWMNRALGAALVFFGLRLLATRK